MSSFQKDPSRSQSSKLGSTTSEASKRPIALLVRVDRMGDLVLTLPVDVVFEKSGFQTHWVISEGLEFFVKHSRKYYRYSVVPTWSRWRGFLMLMSLIRRVRPDVIVVFQGPWWISFAAFLMRIPQRVGPLSRWSSFVFFTARVRQRRSESIKHELEYNLDLARVAVEKWMDNRGSPDKSPLNLDRKNSPLLPTPLQLKIPDHSSEVLSKWDLKAGGYFVVHPGMGGSARNWSVENYRQLIEGLALKGQVVITGTQSDSVYLDPLAKTLNCKNVVWLAQKLSGEDLLCVLGQSRGVVAPSTGVLHLAASLGVRTVGIYSPVTVQAPTRWRPLGVNAVHLVPKIKCPGHFKCLMKDCTQFDCLDQINFRTVVEEVSNELTQF